MAVPGGGASTSDGGYDLAAVASEPIVASDQKAVPPPRKSTSAVESGMRTVRAWPSVRSSRLPCIG